MTNDENVYDKRGYVGFQYGAEEIEQDGSRSNFILVMTRFAEECTEAEIMRGAWKELMKEVKMFLVK